MMGLLGLTYLNLFTCWTVCLRELMKTIYDLYISCFLTYFHKLSKIAYENRLNVNNLILSFVMKIANT